MDNAYDPEETGDGSGGGGSSVGERLARLETLVLALASREDLSGMEVRMLKWGIGIVIGSVGLAIAIVKLFP